MKKEYVIPVFVPHLGCPNDCVFCNQKSISGQKKNITKEDARKTIDYFLENIKDKEGEKEIAFFGGSFTGIDEKIQNELLELANEYIKTFDQEIAISETKFHRGSLRSGQKMEVEGSIVIIGDVNSGAEIIASDNIVVVGNLRGLAHAGAKGNKQAIIAAGVFDPAQVRIANIVREIDREEEPLHKNAYLYVDSDKIIIE